MDPRKRHNPNYKENKFIPETDIGMLNARKARQFPSSLNRVPKQNNPV